MVTEGKWIGDGHLDFHSLEEFAAAVEELLLEADASDYHAWCHPDNDSWAGIDRHGLAVSRKKALQYARLGWTDWEDEVLDLAANAVDEVAAEIPMTTFGRRWDVTGQHFDIGRFMSGDPECMARRVPQPTTRCGRVITICASICYSASIEADVMVERGKVLTAFAVACARMGMGVELWADMSGERTSAAYGTRVKIKDAGEVLDTSRILAGFAQPATFRRLGFASCEIWPEKAREAMGGSKVWSRCCPTNPKEDLPEGTIYLPGLSSARNRPDAASELRSLLNRLDLVQTD